MGAMSTKSNTHIVTESATFIGIDYHKRYSVYHAIDAAGNDLAKGRIEHHCPHDFGLLLKRWPHARVVFEASMNWHWLYEVMDAGFCGPAPSTRPPRRLSPAAQSRL